LSLLIDSARAGGRFDAGELRTRVPAVVQRALAETFGAAREALATLFSLEQGRVERLLDAFLTRESGRLPFVPRAVESPIEIAIGQWSLSGRIDRVDALADDRIAVLDYKTAPGFQPSQWFQPRLVDTQLPLYAVALAAGGARLGALVVIELDADTIDYKGVGEGIVSRFRRLPDGRGWDDQVDEWRAALLTLLAEYARGDVRVFARDPRLAQGAYAPLTRIYEQLGDAEGGPDT
jgi:hypothetical protein